ncbi:type II toxin-antitoxin system RelE/ParE family toxin [Galbibacter sp. EGI 63066]|uniref:type II toxin-antitoxin system RelE/ParE family toxin n=1 Tax=Galbibacter sp. EGI 63066 TaxID=2993559 RepID=UPI002248ECF5|nr:type II toxin-antitoxin system RelE/ParE family toxin [Galbibacter sp. EGI 63066]MCX2679046.1 type II toxin-antitoxin system RelE/ParE family toxin [Galbibacter sp. EGI 63066]
MDKSIKPVVWSSRATKDLKKITEFYSKIHGLSKARQIVTELRQATEILKHKNVDTSKIGETDNPFLHLKRKYRKLIKHHCKITYREGRTKIYVVRVFDTRQHPNKNK